LPDDDCNGNDDPAPVNAPQHRPSCSAPRLARRGQAAGSQSCKLVAPQSSATTRTTTATAGLADDILNVKSRAGRVARPLATLQELMRGMWPPARSPQLRRWRTPVDIDGSKSGNGCECPDAYATSLVPPTSIPCPSAVLLTIIYGVVETYYCGRRLLAIRLASDKPVGGNLQPEDDPVVSPPTRQAGSQYAMTTIRHPRHSRDRKRFMRS
jgi:hypothetical protein